MKRTNCQCSSETDKKKVQSQIPSTGGNLWASRKMPAIISTRPNEAAALISWKPLSTTRPALRGSMEGKIPLFHRLSVRTDS